MTWLKEVPGDISANDETAAYINGQKLTGYTSIHVSRGQGKTSMKFTDPYLKTKLYC